MCGFSANRSEPQGRQQWVPGRQAQPECFTGRHKRRSCVWLHADEAMTVISLMVTVKHNTTPHRSHYSVILKRIHQNRKDLFKLVSNFQKHIGKWCWPQSCGSLAAHGPNGSPGAGRWGSDPQERTPRPGTAVAGEQSLIPSEGRSDTCCPHYEREPECAPAQPGTAENLKLCVVRRAVDLSRGTWAPVGSPWEES